MLMYPIVVDTLTCGSGSGRWLDLPRWPSQATASLPSSLLYTCPIQNHISSLLSSTMMKLSCFSAAIAASFVSLWCDDALGFTISHPQRVDRCFGILNSRHRLLNTVLFNLVGDIKLESSYFQMQQIPMATSGKRLDHIVDCSKHEKCDVGER